jgi:hypothetical protein
MWYMNCKITVKWNINWNKTNTICCRKYSKKEKFYRFKIQKNSNRSLFGSWYVEKIFFWSWLKTSAYGRQPFLQKKNFNQKISYVTNLSRLNNGTGDKFIVLRNNSVKCGLSIIPPDKSHKYWIYLFQKLDIFF